MTLRDITCVPTPQLATVFHQLRDKSVPMAVVAERIGMDVRDLKKIVNLSKYRTTGIGLADRILTAVGGNLTALAETGDLTVIASPGDDNALQMARIEWSLRVADGGNYPGPPERRRRVQEIVRHRHEVLERYEGL
jgi:hypothetical protein